MQAMVMNGLLRDREEGGYQLSKVLGAYRNSNAIVVGIPNGGACVASVIAEALSLPLEIMPCRRMKHPAGGKKTIGSVSEGEVFVHESSHTIPQDYISHQIALLRNAISHDTNKYYGSVKRQSFRYRTIILVDDVLSSSDNLMACLRSIRKESPLKIIVAVPIVAAEAARIVGAEADDLKFLRMEIQVESPQEYFAEFPQINDNKVKELLESSRKKVRVYE